MAKTICPECGNAFEGDMGFCPKCGREIKTDGGVRPSAPVTVPDKPPEELMELGFKHMSEGSYDGAIACWTKAVSGGLVPDDDTYSRMVSDAGSCMVRLSQTSEVTLHPGVVDLDLNLDDREFASDLLLDLRSRVSECSTQPTLVNLSTNHMILLSDCFNLYTDMRDMKVLCDGSKTFMDDVLAREQELRNDNVMDPQKAAKFIETNIDFIDNICSAVDRIITHTPDETLDSISDAWSERPNLPYVNDIKVVLNICIQQRVAGKFISKLLTKTLEAQCNAFASKYVAIVK